MLREALNDEMSYTHVVSFRSTSLISLSLLTPFVLDYMTELCGKDDRKQTTPSKENDASMLQNMSHFEKCVFIVGLFVVPIVAFVPTTLNSLALLWLCMSRFQIITVLGILRASMKSLNNNVIFMINPELSMYSQCTFTTILAITVNFSTWTAIYGDNNITQNVTILLQVCLFIMLVVPFGRWLVKLFGRRHKLLFFLNRKIQSWTDPSVSDPKKFPSRSKSSQSDGNIPTSGFSLAELYFPTLYITVGTVSAVLIVALFMTNAEDQFTPNYLSTYNILFIIIQLLLLYYDLRKNKDDSRCHLRALVESRKQYLRYLAHEMRTPLNSAVLGLQVLSFSLNQTHPHSSFIDYLSPLP